MPKRQKDHPLVTHIGRRFHQLRKEKGFSLEQAAHGAGLSGKGYISIFERGYALPALNTLDRLAGSVGADVVDLLNDPDSGLRNRLTEATRHLDDEALRTLLAHTLALREQRSHAKESAADAAPNKP